MPIARSNCLRVVVYSAVIRSASWHAPAVIAQMAVMVRSRTQRRFDRPSAISPMRAASVTSTPSSFTTNCGSWFIVSWRSSVIPSAWGETRKSPISSPTRAGTRMPLGDVRLGHVDLLTRDPPAVARALGDRLRLVGGSAELVERRRQDHVAADDAGQLLALLAVPNSAMGIATETSVWINGSGATVRPCSWRMRQSSRKP